MVYFATHAAIFLAGVTWVTCIPTVTPESGAESTAADSLDVVQVINTLAQLPAEQKEAMKEPLQELSNNFENTIFGCLFSFILRQVQNPSEETNDAEIEEILKKTIGFEAFIAAIQQLPQNVITESLPQFDKLIEILGDSELSKLFQEISSILTARKNLPSFQFAQMGSEMPMDMTNVLSGKSGNPSASQQTTESASKSAERPEQPDLTHVDQMKNFKSRFQTVPLRNAQRRGGMQQRLGVPYGISTMKPNGQGIVTV